MDDLEANITKRAAGGKKCYFPDGSWAEHDYPCFPDDKESMCCAERDQCMSNKFCRSPGDLSKTRIRYQRKSCTDWTSGACTDTCTNANKSTITYVSECWENAGYCCDAEYETANYAKCCEWRPSFLFSLSEATAVATIPYGGFPWTSSASSTSVSSSISTSSSDSTAIPSLAGPGPSRGGEGFRTTPAITSPSASPEPPQASNNNTLPIALGAGIGGGIFAISCVLLGVWLVRRRRAALPSPPAPLDNLDGGDIYLTPQGWQSQQQQPFLFDHKPPAYQPRGGWPPQPFPAAYPTELAISGQGRPY